MSPLPSGREFFQNSRTIKMEVDMSSLLYEYFTNGTRGSKTGKTIGMEIETDFVRDNGTSISSRVAATILQARNGRPRVCRHQLELGRQKIELAIAPQPNQQLLIEAAYDSLEWLYRLAAEYGAYPLLEPEIVTDQQLLWVQEERDELWVNLDGRDALEQLCRCSSFQFTMSVNPEEAIPILNQLWQAGVHEWDYDLNNARWLAYIALSRAGYLSDRYGGPVGFEDLYDYVYQLSRHDVVMHNGRIVRYSVEQLPDPNIDLFLRSIWWHYRLRRYGDTLALEMRPFARRSDDQIPVLLSRLSEVIGL